MERGNWGVPVARPHMKYVYFVYIFCPIPNASLNMTCRMNINDTFFVFMTVVIKRHLLFVKSAPQTASTLQKTNDSFFLKQICFVLMFQLRYSLVVLLKLF